MPPTFVHLRLHTEYSLQDSVVRIPELVERTERADERVLHDILAQHRVASQIASQIIGPVEVRHDHLPK